MKKAIRLGIGIFFVVTGVLGLVLPIIPGILFILLGLLAFSTVYEPMGRIFDWLQKKYPKVNEPLQRWRKKLFPDIN